MRSNVFYFTISIGKVAEHTFSTGPQCITRAKNPDWAPVINQLPITKYRKQNEKPDTGQLLSHAGLRPLPRSGPLARTPASFGPRFERARQDISYTCSAGKLLLFCGLRAVQQPPKKYRRYLLTILLYTRLKLCRYLSAILHLRQNDVHNLHCNRAF